MNYEETFEPTFNKWGYEGYYKKRNGGKKDGCALFFRKDRYHTDNKHQETYGHLGGDAIDAA